MSDIAKVAIFTKQVIESMGIKVDLPIVIRCDNIGAMYLANNHSTSQRTKHIDIRTHFVRQFIEDDILKVVFVKSGENESGPFTKNLGEELQVKHNKKLIMDVDSKILNRKDVKIT